MRFVLHFTLITVFLFVSQLALAQQHSAEELLDAQRKELVPLQMMDGIWRGNAWTILPDGKKLERIVRAWSPWRAVGARILWHHYLSVRK